MSRQTMSALYLRQTNLQIRIEVGIESGSQKLFRMFLPVFLKKTPHLKFFRPHVFRSAMSEGSPWGRPGERRPPVQLAAGDSGVISEPPGPSRGVAIPSKSAGGPEAVRLDDISGNRRRKFSIRCAVCLKSGQKYPEMPHK